VRISQVLPGYAPSYAPDYMPEEVNHTAGLFSFELLVPFSRYSSFFFLVSELCEFCPPFPDFPTLFILVYSSYYLNNGRPQFFGS
jgi:hypothetical protein